MAKHEDTDDKQETPVQQPEFSEDGVDLTLIRWMLSLTPSERLRVLQDNIQSISRLRRDPSSR